MKAGGQHYIPVDMQSECGVGDVVDLTKAQVKTLTKRGEADILRVSL